MPVSQQGAINTTALYVPDVYVQIVPPSENYLNGLPTDILGIVGTAQWGPVNAPATVGSVADYVQKFGNIQARKYDMGTAACAANLNGANDMRCVRVTDGTDTAASGTITAASAADATVIATAINQGISGIRGASQLVIASAATTKVTITAKYTGSLGNALGVIVAPGSKAPSTRVTITLPGLVPEAFDNLGAASAAAASVTLAGGTDGATGVGSTQLLGVDGSPRTGMYALRGSGVSVAMITDCDDKATWSDQVAFGLSEGVYMVATGPVGDTIDNAVSTKASAGIDSYAMKLLLGDWCYFNDTVNGQIRLISPQGFVAGRLSALSPEQSSLNKPLYGIVGTQKSSQNLTYSQAELQQLAQAGIDVIANPIPAGNSFGVRIGQNCSSNAVINGDNYTRLTNYIAYTLNAGMGLYIGMLQSPAVRQQAAGTINAFLSSMWQQAMIGDVNNPTQQPFSVQLNAANNPPDRVALGYMQIDCRVTYLSVITKLIINVEGGQSVTVTPSSSVSA